MKLSHKLARLCNWFGLKTPAQKRATANRSAAAKAAKELGRRFIGLEINPEYCAIAERRIAQETLQLEAV